VDKDIATTIAAKTVLNTFIRIHASLALVLFWFTKIHSSRMADENEAKNAAMI
jgi:hypothetical protein